MGDLTVKDSGERSTYDSGAQRDNHSGKGRYDLMATQALMRLARWYELGNAKYGKKTIRSLEEILTWMASFVATAESLSIITPEEDVVTVTKSGLDAQTLNMLKDKEKTLASGSRTIQTKCVLRLSKDGQILDAGKETKRQKEDQGSKNSGWTINHSIKSSIPRREDAQFAREISKPSNPFILIMIMQAEEQEVSFAVVATTALECLEMMWEELRELSSISYLPPTTFEMVNNQIQATYEDNRNWEKGMPFSRYADAAFRHLLKWVAGWNDEDHLAAAAWNVFCLMHHEQRHPNLQDLPEREGLDFKYVIGREE